MADSTSGQNNSYLRHFSSCDTLTDIDNKEQCMVCKSLMPEGDNQVTAPVNIIDSVLQLLCSNCGGYVHFHCHMNSRETEPAILIDVILDILSNGFICLHCKDNTQQ